MITNAEASQAAPSARTAAVRVEYQRRLEARAGRVAAHDRRHAHLAWWRFGIAASGVGLIVWLGRPGLPWLIVPALLFAAVAIRHALVLNARDRAARAVDFYQRGLRRLDDTWPGTGETGERFRSEHHPYAEDLDLFGRGSLFELLSSPRTAAGEATGERVWRMPLGTDYDKMIDSRFADMKNVGGRDAGAITGAQFLKRFVKDVPWVHLDIAGTGMNSPQTEINRSWASGYGVRLLDRLVSDAYEK